MMKNKALFIITAVIIGIFVFSFVRDNIVKSVITITASRMIGAPVHIGGFSMSVMRQSAKITGLKIYNPKNKGFEPGTIVDMPLIKVSADAWAIIRGNIHLKFIELELKEVGLIRNKQGLLNVDSLKIVEAKDKKESKPMAMQIDVVKLDIGRIISKDYTVTGEPLIKVYDINIKKTYKNITSAQQLAALIIAEPLKAAGIRGAAIYGVSMLAGVAALPVAAVFTFAGKDYNQAVFNASRDKVYASCLKVLKNSGAVEKEDKTAGIINADVKGSTVTLTLKGAAQGAQQVTVTARKYMLPQPELAAGIIYQIADELK